MGLSDDNTRTRRFSFPGGPGLKERLRRLTQPSAGAAPAGGAAAPATAERDYVYQAARGTIRDTREQLKRNSSGQFGSLGEFAQHHHVDTRGKVFAHCAETGDVLAPKIDLDAVNAAQRPRSA